MTRHRDIDHVLEAWFVDGPLEMPDRLFEAVFDRVERVPQRRLARLHLRFTDMSTTARLIAAVAAAAFVVGLGLAVFGRGPDARFGASPSPSASPSGSPGAAPVPAELRYAFLGELRPSPAPPGQDRSIIVFKADNLTYNDGLLASTATTPAAGRLLLVSENVAGGCAVGDEGTYSWRLSPGGSKLTVTLENDSCAARGKVVAGDWQRSNCDRTDDLCLGDLEAGRYSSQFIDPFVPLGAPWKARFGALTYQVPAGWSNTEDFPLTYRLARQTAPADTGIYLNGDVVIVSEEDPCAETPAPNVGRTAQAIADWLAAASGVVAADPIPVTVGGLRGWRLDVSMDPAWTTACAYTEGRPMRGLFTGSQPGYQLGVEAGDHIRLFVLDPGDGRALVVSVQARTQADYDALVDEATTIVESFEFPR